MHESVVHGVRKTPGTATDKVHHANQLRSITNKHVCSMQKRNASATQLWSVPKDAERREVGSYTKKRMLPELPERETYGK